MSRAAFSAVAILASALIVFAYGWLRVGFEPHEPSTFALHPQVADWAMLVFLPPVLTTLSSFVDTMLEGLRSPVDPHRLDYGHAKWLLSLLATSTVLAIAALLYASFGVSNENAKWVLGGSAAAWGFLLGRIHVRFFAKAETGQ